MTFSLRLSDTDAEIIRNYAKTKNLTVSEVMRVAVMEHIESELDVLAFDEALEEYRRNPIIYSQDEVEKELGLI